MKRARRPWWHRRIGRIASVTLAYSLVLAAAACTGSTGGPSAGANASQSGGPQLGPGGAGPTGGPPVDPTVVERSNKALKEHGPQVAASSADAFAVRGTHSDPDKASHARYARTYRGLPVLGGDIVVHNHSDGSFAGASVGLTAPLTLDVVPK